MTERSPRMAIQGQERHRHFKISGDGYAEHAHAIGQRVHEHLYARLGRVVLSWAEWPPRDHPEYVDEKVVPDELALTVVGFILAIVIVAAFLYLVSR